MLNKKTTVALAVLSLSTLAAANSSAATQGVYLGGQLGYGNVHQKVSKPSGVVNSFSSKDKGIAGRVFGGYQVNENFAGELGWSKFSNAETKGSGKIGSVSVNAKETIKTDAVDLVAKGIYPVAAGVNVYGKAGVAYVMAREDGKATASANVGKTIIKGTGKISETEKKLLPTFGAGVSYDFTPNVAADLSYNRIQKTGSTSLIKSTDLVSVGLIYSIG